MTERMPIVRDPRYFRPAVIWVSPAEARAIKREARLFTAAVTAAVFVGLLGIVSLVYLLCG